MCLISKWRFPKKAKEDIVCYKVLIKSCGKYYTPFTGDSVDVHWDFVAKENSFSLLYNPHCKGIGYIHTLKSNPFREFIKSYFGCGKYVVFKCIIPKGTKYHYDSHNMYCSKKIHFIKQVNKFNIYE